MTKIVPESDQKEIRSVLLSKVGGIKIRDFLKDFKALTGQKLEYRKYGFTSLEELFESIPDVAKVLFDQKDQTDKVYGVTGNSLVYVNATAEKAQYKEGELPARSKDRKRNRSRSSASKTTVTPVVNNKSSAKMPSRPETLDEIRQVLMPNMKGFYAICFPRNLNMTRDKVNTVFTEYGELAETSFTDNFVFLRYLKKDAAVQAYINHRVEYDIRIPYEKNDPKRVIKDKDPTYIPERNRDKRETILGNADGQNEDHLDVFVGNMSENTTEHDLRNHFADVDIESIRLKRSSDGMKNFAFIVVKSKADLAKMVSKHGSSQLNNRHLVIQQSFKDGGVTEQTPEDKILLQSMTKHSLSNDGFKSGTPPRPGNNYTPPRPGNTYSSPRPANHYTPQRAANKTLEEVAHDMDQPPPLLDGVEDEEYNEEYVEEAALIPTGQPNGRGQAMPNGRPQENSYNFKMDSGTGDHQMFELFVSNFPFFTSWKQLLELFSPFDAHGVRMQNNSNVGRTTIAFVQFVEYEKAVEAFVNMDGLEFRGRPLKVNFAHNSFAPEDVVLNKLKGLKLTLNIKGAGEEERLVSMEGNDTPREIVFNDAHLDENPSRPYLLPNPMDEESAYNEPNTKPFLLPNPDEEEYYEEEYYEEGYEQAYYPPQRGRGRGYYGGYQHQVYQGDQRFVQFRGQYNPGPHGGYNPRPRGGYNPALRGGYNPGVRGGFNPGPRGGFNPGMRGGYSRPFGYNRGGGRGRGEFFPSKELKQPGQDQSSMPSMIAQSMTAQNGIGAPSEMQRQTHPSQPRPQHNQPTSGINHQQANGNANEAQNQTPNRNAQNQKQTPPRKQNVQTPPRKQNVQTPPRKQNEQTAPRKENVHNPQTMEYKQTFSQTQNHRNQNSPQKNSRSNVQRGYVDDGPPPLEAISPQRRAPQSQPDYTDVPPLEPCDDVPPLENLETEGPPPLEMLDQGVPALENLHNGPPPLEDVPPLETISKDRSRALPTSDGPRMTQQGELLRMITDVCPHIGLVVTADLPQDQEICVLVTHIEDNARYFWGQLVIPGFLEGINELQEKTQLMLQEPPTDPLKDNRGAILFEDMWARVWVIRRKTYKAEVFYMDYGNTEVVELSRIRGLPDHYWGLPPQAVPFHISDSGRWGVNVYSKEEMRVLPSPNGQDTLIEVTR